MIISCRYNYTLYPRGKTIGSTDFGIVKYLTDEPISTPQGLGVTRITAKGYGLPTSEKLSFLLEGDWEVKRNKNGQQTTFIVRSFSEQIPTTKEGTALWLSSLKGIGPKMAERICQKFEDPYTILDNNIERLLEVKGISQRTLEKIKESLFTKREGRELTTMLRPYHISEKKIMQIYRKLGVDAMKIILENPYKLLAFNGIGFRTADQIAIANNCPADAPGRIDAAIYEVLSQAERGGSLFGLKETSGHMYLDWATLSDKCISLLGGEIDNAYHLIATRCAELNNCRKIRIEDQAFYRDKAYEAEMFIAKKLCRIMHQDRPKVDFDNLILLEERLTGITLADKQKEAVKTCLASPVSIITGGPGTGKTMIEKIILSIYESLYPEKELMLVAPTGAAAKRMTESTGRRATTIHQALKLNIAEDDAQLYPSVDELECDLLIVDEASMIGSYLVDALLSRVRDDTQIVFIGDTYQLPSIEAGSVLREMIDSETIPTIRLERVYRQKNGSCVAINAARIKAGELQYLEDESFQFIETDNPMDVLQELYAESVKKYGLSQVSVLCPFRVENSRTQLTVDNINAHLRMLINPPAEKAAFLPGPRGKAYYPGDKVIYTKNLGCLTNGDIGTVESINRDFDGTYALIDFGQSGTHPFYETDAENLDLAYATTIHKSQGAEYKAVLITLDNSHKIMLRRNLVYTAISRSKEIVYIIGKREAFEEAVLKDDSMARNSNLGRYLRQLI